MPNNKHYFTLRAQGALVRNEVRLILLVLAANKLQNVGIRNQPQIHLQGKRPSVVFRVIEGHIQLHVPEVAAVVALAVLDMLLEIKTAANAETWVRNELTAGRRIMGFGHRVYKVRDPRAEDCRHHQASFYR